jgi:hypothetical protein
MKKKVEKSEVKTNHVNKKIFNIIEFNDQLYFLDHELNLILDSNIEVVGIYNKNNYIFFDKIDKIIHEIIQTNLNII